MKKFLKCCGYILVIGFVVVGQVLIFLLCGAIVIGFWALIVYGVYEAIVHLYHLVATWMGS